MFICFDSAGPVLKASEVKEYKADREWTQDKETMYAQVPALRELLATTKYDQVEAEGYEADDCIGYVTRKMLERQNMTVCILTLDNDLCQLVGPNVYVRTPNKEKLAKNEQWVKDHYGVWPSQLLLLRCFLGDTSDNLACLMRGQAHLDSLRKTLLALPRHTDIPYNMNNLLVQAVHDGETELVEMLRDPDFRSRLDANYQVMSLHSPNNIKVTKGRRDRSGLEALFTQMEFNPTGPRSMWKFIPEFIGTAGSV